MEKFKSDELFSQLLVEWNKQLFLAILMFKAYSVSRPTMLKVFFLSFFATCLIQTLQNLWSDVRRKTRDQKQNLKLLFSEAAM